MKVFVTGAAGQLGYEVLREIGRRGNIGIGSDIKESPDIGTGLYIQMDITDPAEVLSTLENIRPDVVVHCAAWTAVDLAEDREIQEKVWAVNVSGTDNIVQACKRLGCRMVYISTDYVFDGKGTLPWEPDCKEFGPLNVYGRTKLEGERSVSQNLEKYFIVRIAWVFGKNGSNFVRTMLKIGKTHGTVSVVNDQIGTPTYAYDLARLLADMIETEKYGYYHATNEGGYISWYEFASEIFRQAAQLGYPEYDGGHLKVVPVTTSEYGAGRAARPFNSRMDKSKLWKNGFTPLPEWKDALRRYLKELGFKQR